ncbi:MAG: cytochrome c oxidase assembly protein [Proteobacteria bacterium]|nr:cytochrome c oxidase assembly protein [Pseudomonadota bacterium]
MSLPAADGKARICICYTSLEGLRVWAANIRKHQREHIPGVTDCPPHPHLRRSPNFRLKRIWWLSMIAAFFGLMARLGWLQLASDGFVRRDLIFDPVIMAAAALACLIYALGAMRGATSTLPLRRWRLAAFATGIGMVLLALEPPLGALARQLFLARQLQDLLLGIVAPILIVISMPGAALISGLFGEKPSNVPSCQTDDTELRADSIWRCAGATALSIVVFSIWLYPPLQNAAVTSPFAETTLSVTTFGVALLFWSFIFDFRPLPAGAGYGSRLMMLWITSLSHIGIGAYLVVKTEILYSAYGPIARHVDISPLTDETVGGFIIWVPSALLCLAAVIMVIHLWGLHENRIWAKYSNWSSSNSAALLFPTTGEQLIALARPKNRAQAIAVVTFVVAVFGFTIISGILNHINNERRADTRGPLVAQHLLPHSVTAHHLTE